MKGRVIAQALLAGAALLSVRAFGFDEEVRHRRRRAANEMGGQER